MEKLGMIYVGLSFLPWNFFLFFFFFSLKMIPYEHKLGKKKWYLKIDQIRWYHDAVG